MRQTARRTALAALAFAFLDSSCGAMRPSGSLRLFRHAAARPRGMGRLGDIGLIDIDEKRQFGDVESKFAPQFVRKFAHDDMLYRTNGKLETARVPSAERYTSRDWVHNMLTLPRSSVLNRIKQPVIVLTIWSALVWLLDVYFSFGSPKTKPHTLLSSALGLLLVFRTNAAYQRFWEGRKIWQGIQDDVRDLTRLAATHVPFVGEDLVRETGRMLCTFPWVLREHLTGMKPSAILSLTPRETEQLEKARNRPMFIINKLSAKFGMVADQGAGATKELPNHVFSSRERLALIGILSRLGQRVGAAERLVQTPVPLMYARHTSRFLTVWCVTLPIVIVNELRFWVVPLMALVAWSLFGILEIAHLVEQPFAKHCLKLNVICDQIALDVRDTIRDTTAEYAAAAEHGE